MADLAIFAKRIAQTADRVTRNSDRITRATALSVDSAVVLATPVDEGRARANWQARAGQAADDTIEPYAEGSEGSTGGANAQGAMDQARREIVGAPDDSEFHITNNLPYIGRLNDGSSQQAPAGFVDTAVEAGRQTVRRSRILAAKPTDSL